MGKLIIGVLSDEAVASYKRLPLVPASERKVMFENIAGVCKVVDQNTLSYKENLEKYKPSIVVHGDDWATGFQRPIRDEVTGPMAESLSSILIPVIRSIRRLTRGPAQILPCRISAADV